MYRPIQDTPASYKATSIWEESRTGSCLMLFFLFRQGSTSGVFDTSVSRCLGIPDKVALRPGHRTSVRAEDLWFTWCLGTIARTFALMMFQQSAIGHRVTLLQSMHEEL